MVHTETKTKLRNPSQEEIEVYNAISGARDKSGVYHKTCFHLHTPASFDYRLKQEWTPEQYLEIQDAELLKLCQEERIILPQISIDDISEDDIRDYSNKKEFLSYLLLAERLIINNIEVVLVADHNTIDGVTKLRYAVDWISATKIGRCKPIVLLGIEISCADKNHVVGFFEDTDHNRNKIRGMLEQNSISLEDGVYITSFDVLSFIKSCGAIGYIAHINSSDILTKGIFSAGYKKKLFDVDTVNYIGLSSLDVMERVTNQLKSHRKAPVKFVVDNDAHDIDSVGTNCFWLKGGACSYGMVREALNDYNISVEFEKPQSEKQHITGLLAKNNGLGFLKGKTGNHLCIHFSDALNCLIGGRGTGKSSVLELLEYSLSQYCRNESALENICKYSSLWILYFYEEHEYLIRIDIPSKEYPDDHIMSCFGQCHDKKLAYKYSFDAKQVQRYATEKFLHIVRIIPTDDLWVVENVANKQEFLSHLFDTKYSINELVNTASSLEMHFFILDTLLKNHRLSSFGDMSSFRRKTGLSKMLDRAQEILELRKNEVESVITPFNEQCDGTLRIIYKQKSYGTVLDFWGILFSNRYNERAWYKMRNITYEDICDYLTELFVRLGPIEFFKVALQKDVAAAETTVQIKKYCTPMSKALLERGISELNFTDWDEILKDLFNRLVGERNIVYIKDYFKRYITEIESFELEFNINNREGGAQQEIYKRIQELSLGQKVVAMLSFILAYSDYSQDYRPLIIDQPEDNLDNQYIYKNLVNQLRQIKKKRQVIIATHNATIVTNAKADLVCVMESDNIHGWVETSGYPSDTKIKKKILNHLEGGKDSFLHKMQIYKNILE